LGRLGGKLLDGDPVLFDEIEGSLTIEVGPGLPEWRGGSWLPEGGRVEPGRTYGLIRDDGRAGERIVESFGPDGTGGDVAWDRSGIQRQFRSSGERHHHQLLVS
jgi:hypothetical protein